MEITVIINLVLWAVFGLVVLISGLIFCITGYRQGLWQALISLTATAVSAVLSIVLANLIARPLGQTLYQALSMGDGDLLTALFAQGAIKILLALGIFCLLLLIFTITLKLVSKKLFHTPNVKKWQKFAGLGVRLVDTLLFSLLFLLPLYGTLAAYAPSAQSLMHLAQTKDARAMAAIECVADHPAVQLSGSAPISAAYKSLSSMDTENGSINPAAAAQSLAGTMTRLEKIADRMESGQLEAEEVRELLQYLRQDVLKQDWCYEAYQSGLDMLEESLQAEEDPEAWQILALMRMNKADFQTNMGAILSFMEAFLDEDILNKLMAQEGSVASIFYEKDLIYQFGELINTSQQACALRDLLLHHSLGNHDMAYLLAERNGRQYHDREQQRLDGEAFLVIFLGGSRTEAYEALLRMPDVADHAVKADFDSTPIDVLLPSRQWPLYGEGEVIGPGFSMGDIPANVEIVQGTDGSSSFISIGGIPEDMQITQGEDGSVAVFSFADLPEGAQIVQDEDGGFMIILPGEEGAYAGSFDSENAKPPELPESEEDAALRVELWALLLEKAARNIDGEDAAELLQQSIENPE